ncbi:MAG: hypothetical protein KGP14_13365 [Betaproteobacteria bacterium]|nr:hypothetical protein [Betaproteobacteria bacterium]
MIYAQIKSGLKLHLAYEAGEGRDASHLTPTGHVSAPLCGERSFKGQYRMTINVPLANACKKCIRAELNQAKQEAMAG